MGHGDSNLKILIFIILEQFKLRSLLFSFTSRQQFPFSYVHHLSTVQVAPTAQSSDLQGDCNLQFLIFKLELQRDNLLTPKIYKHTAILIV